MVLAKGWQDRPAKALRDAAPPFSLFSSPAPSLGRPTQSLGSTWAPPGPTEANPHFMGDSHVQAACAPWDRYGRPQPGGRGTAPGPVHHTRAHAHSRTHACLCVNPVGARHGGGEAALDPPGTPGPAFTLSSFASISTTSVSTSSIVALQQERRWLQTNPPQAAGPEGQVRLGLPRPVHLPSLCGCAVGPATCSGQPPCCPMLLRHGGNGSWERQMPPWAEGEGLGPRSS